MDGRVDLVLGDVERLRILKYLRFQILIRMLEMPDSHLLIFGLRFDSVLEAVL